MSVYLKGDEILTALIMKYIKAKEKGLAPDKRRTLYGITAAFVGMAINIFLCIIKGLAGILFNSVAILADAVNNLSDAGNSVITLIGFVVSQKPADEDHPYGHARGEYISCLGVSFVILMLGFTLFKTSAVKILKPEPIDKSILSVAVLTVSILVKIWLGFFYKKVGTTINSSVIEANSKDSFNDVISTSAVLLTTAVAIGTDINLDAYAGCVVAVFILYSGYQIMRETVNNLMGSMPSRETVEKIVEKLRSYEGVMGIHDLVVHSYGPDKYFATVHVEVPCNVNILTSHDMIDNIERDFADELGINMVIHLDPVVTDDGDVLKVRHMVYDTVREIDASYSIHDFRMVKGDTHSNLIFDIAIPASEKINEKDLIAEVESEIKKIDKNYYCIITVDRLYV